MDPRQLFVDERLIGLCSYCGGLPDTRDHVPSRVLLDDPYPPNLPIVDACRSCNESFSQDEEYLACLIECAICGSVEPDQVLRPKIAQTLRMRPLLSARLQESRSEGFTGEITWRADMERVRNVIVKLARGHMAFDLSIPQLFEPDTIEIMPLIIMSPEERHSFEFPQDTGKSFFPEIGSRAFISMFKSPSTDWEGWQIVQPGRYRYRVGQSIEGNSVHMVIREYLACRVGWY